MNLKYQIEFFTDWHCGSGLSAGADLDALVIKDRNGLPFIPGKTMKGLIREAVEEIDRLSGCSQIEKIKEVFGSTGRDKKSKELTANQGVCFFANATLNKDLSNAIIEANTARYFYRTISSTKIDEVGIAEDHSLRKIQVTIPCILEGEILNMPDEFKENMKNGLLFIKRLGQNRNRGLGRCSITILQKKEESK